MDLQPTKDFAVSGEDFFRAAKGAGGGFVKGHAPGAAAGAVAEISGLEQQDGFGGRVSFEMRSRGKPGEAASHDDEISALGKGSSARMEDDGPGRLPPIRTWRISWRSHCACWMPGSS